MPKNSSGQYNAPASSWSPATNGNLALAGDWNSLLADISSALTDSLSRNGNGGMNSNLAMGNNRITSLAAGTGSGDAATWNQLFGVGVMADIASAATVDIGAQNTSFLRMTGTTTVTSFGTNYRGPRFITFEGSLTLTNSSTLVLPGGANITTAAGDSLIVIPGATAGTADKWVVVAYQKNAVPGFTPNGSITTEKIANNAITPAKLANGGLELGGFRNRIINGDMRIDQRNNGAAVAVTTAGQYTLDRWAVASQTSFGGQLTAQRSTTVPAGFTNSLSLTVSTADASIGAAEYYSCTQRLEGFNVADFGWGAAGASTVTLSFWVRASIAGTYSGSLRNNASDRSYVFEYSIAAANTWEYKTIQITGDTTGTWLKDNGVGIDLWWSVGTGSSFRSSTVGAWQSGAFLASNNQTQLIGTLNATFHITGVQLEAGSVATPFERRPYGTELALCQRYFYREQGGTLIYGTIQTGSGAYESASITGAFPVPMRAAPSLTFTGDRGYFIPCMASVTPSGDVTNAAPSSGAPGSVVVGPLGITRATMSTNGLVRGVQYRNACFDGGTLACSAEL